MMTPHGTWFSLSGRIGANKIINFRSNSPAGIHLIEPEVLNELFPDLKFIQNTSQKAIKFFEKLTQTSNIELIKKILEKMGKSKDYIESLKFWIDNLLP